MRIFQWLVLTLSDRDDHYLGVLTDIEQRWADQVADVLDEEPGSRLRIQCLDRLLDHRCIEVASGSGIHLNCAGASPPDAVTVKGGFLVALNDTDRRCIAQISNGALQQGSLPRTRGAHQIQRGNALLSEQVTIVLGQVIVLGQDCLTDDQIFGARNRSLDRIGRLMAVVAITMLVIMMLVVLVVGVVLMSVGVIVMCVIMPLPLII